jgi:DNA primase
MGETKFFVARSIGVPKGAGKRFLKEKSPSTEGYQYSKSQVLFNIDGAVKIFNSCVLSEGVYDALSFDDIGVSALGKRVSEEQLALLLDYKEYLTGGVYLGLDSDANKDTLKLADTLVQYFPVYLLEIPNGHDPNSYLKAYGKKAMYELIDSAHEYDLTYKLKRKFFV